MFCGDVKLEKNETVPVASGTRIYLTTKAHPLMLK